MQRSRTAGKSFRRLAVAGGAIAIIALGVVGVVVFRQVSPPLPPALAALGGVAVTPPGASPRPLRSRLTPGAATIVSFWATWCVPCRAEAATLAALARTYPSRRLTIVYLNVEDGPDPAAVRAFLARANAGDLTTLLAGPAGWRAITGSRLVSLPRTYVFDAAGRPVSVLTGFGPESAGTLAALVETAMKAGT